MIKVIIFDLDGTLIDTRERFFMVFNKTLESFSLNPLTKRRFNELYSRASLDEAIPKELQKNFWEKFLHDYGRTCSEKDSPFPGVKNVLKVLKRKGLKICVVTGRACAESDVWTELKKHGLAEYVDAVASKDVKVKDHFFKDEEVSRILAKLSVKPHECLIVGDYLADIETGKKMGSLTVAVLSGGVKREVLESADPDLVLESVNDLPSIVDILASKPSKKGCLELNI